MLSHDPGGPGSIGGVSTCVHGPSGESATATRTGQRIEREVTDKTGLGRHTTTRTELFPLANGGFIADSPGIRGFDPWDMDPLAVRDYFPDFRAPGQTCHYRTCLHRDEPRCGVKDAVARGLIPGWRHAAYLALLADLEDRKARAGYR